MSKTNPAVKRPCEILFEFLDERIKSCERKRSQNLFRMNFLKVVRVTAGVLALFFVAILAADVIPQQFKFVINLAALVCSAVTALTLDLSTAFGFESRFKQNVQSSGKLRRLKVQLELEISLRGADEDIDYGQWFNKISGVLNDQSVAFDSDFDRAHKSK